MIFPSVIDLTEFSYCRVLKVNLAIAPFGLPFPLPLPLPLRDLINPNVFRFAHHPFRIDIWSGFPFPLQTGEYQ
jgi:hypothetical protein